VKQLNSHMFEKVYKQLKINIDTLGCIMLDIQPLKNMYTIEADGAGVILYYAKNKERKWIDGWVCGKVAHVTLLYGLIENGHNLEKQISQVLEGWKMNTIEIENIGYFDSPYKDEPYYCIVAHVKITPKLMEGHQRLEFLPHINTFTDYKAHMTICYIKKDKDQLKVNLKWMNKAWAGKKLKVKQGINLGYLPKKEDSL
jgi:hypothetical protein